MRWSAIVELERESGCLSCWNENEEGRVGRCVCGASIRALTVRGDIWFERGADEAQVLVTDVADDVRHEQWACSELAFEFTEAERVKLQEGLWASYESSEEPVRQTQREAKDIAETLMRHVELALLMNEDPAKVRKFLGDVKRAVLGRSKREAV